MVHPLVSIVIDNFNYARFLVQSIDSALTQTYPHVEVIVVDDASTDGSRAIVEGYLPRVRAVFQASNRGQGAAFNEGFLVSCGDIVMFLDADDWLYSDAVQRIVSAWLPGQSKTHFRLHLVDAAGVTIDIHPAPEVRLDRGDVVPLLLELGRYETVVTSGNAFARAALAANLPMPEEPFRIAADGYLATVVPFHGPVNCIEECLGAYRMHGANAYGNARAPAGDELCLRTRKFLAHDAHKEPVLRGKARAGGLDLKGDPQLRDPAHLELRIASLRLDPANHPYPGDRRLMLALRGVAASRRARLPWPRRTVIALWFMVAALLPTRVALPAIRWKMQPTTRPGGVDRHIKRLRRLLS
jgi:hypothetical protein